MNITFAKDWNAKGSNEPVYATEAKEYAMSAREIEVFLGKILLGGVKCDSRERESVAALMDCLQNGVEIQVNKGMHPDKLMNIFGPHVSVVITRGAYSGTTFHVYAHLVSHAYEPYFVCMFKSGLRYTADHSFLPRKPTRATIEIEAARMPDAAIASKAEIARLLR